MQLNADYLASDQNGDVQRYGQILAEDFMSSLPEFLLRNKKQFLEMMTVPRPFTELKVDDVRIRLLGDFAIIHSHMTFRTERRCITSRSIYRRLAAAGRKMALRGGKRYCRRLVRRQLCHIARNMTWWCSAAVGQDHSPGRLRRRGSDRRSSNGGMSQDPALASRACRARI